MRLRPQWSSRYRTLGNAEIALPKLVKSYFYSTELVTEILATNDGDEDDVAEIAAFIAEMRCKDPVIPARPFVPIDA